MVSTQINLVIGYGYEIKVPAPNLKHVKQYASVIAVYNLNEKVNIYF